MTIAPNVSAAVEPGREHFDLKSTSWSNVAEHIELSVDHPKYCFNCVIFLAAYGYAAGSFTLQATSRGIVTLQDNLAVGGAITKNSFNYYSYFTSDPYAEMTITLTTITGDADLYVTKRTKKDNKLVLPSKSNYVWRSLFYGSDTISIAYDDKDFCSDCEYLIGVTGYTNATFTLSVVSKSASIIRLRPNRPQNAELNIHETMHFSSELPSTTADVTISVTSISTGSADIYVRLVNASALTSGRPVLPDPADPRTYTYSTRYSQDSHVFIPGPRTSDDDAVALITVVALTAVRFVAIVGTSDRPVLLQLGVPQSHYVAAGGNSMFVLYPDPYDDLRVSVTGKCGNLIVPISTMLTIN